MSQEPVYVGLDVAKATLDVAVRPGNERRSVPNDEPGIAGLVARLRPLAPHLVVAEATGGFEQAAIAALAAAGLPVVVANPRQIRDFAKGTGQLAKTDALDAGILALFAERVRPTPRPLPNELTQPQPVRTVTVDNGTEFHDYTAVDPATGARFYFATPHHAWERGTNENTNGLLRQYLPKRQSMARLTQHDCNRIATRLNRRPRKRLGYRTPEECYAR